MKKRFLLLFAGMMLLVGSIWARPVDAAKARAVAETWMRAKGMAKVSSLVDVTAQTPFTEFYVFAAPDGGFILVSGDDCVIPVLGYSTHNRFEAKEIPAHVLSWLRSYEKEIRYWKKQESRAAAQNLHSLGSAEQWGMLERGAMPLTTLSSSVAPLMTTTWNQSPLYNRFCPTNGGDDDRAVTGCVATATAQVMKYHNYPAQGYGSFTYNSYRVINDVEYAYNNLTANFGATTYQWNNMPNALTSASSDAEINAVATLMYHIGVADSMRYSPHASGAQNYNTIGLLQPTTQTSLMKYFKYRPDMAAVSRDDYEHETFTSILRAELDQSRPILFSGSDEEGGHSFVLDGYNTDGYFHVNWGWAGWYDDYYVIGGLEPAGGGIGANMGSYNLNDVALIGIRPNTNWSTTGTTVVTATSSLASATVLGGGTYNFGSTVTLAAEAPEGYRFERWSDNDHFNPRQIYANGGSYSFNATFSALGGDTLSFCGNKGMISAYRLSYPFWGVKLPSSVMDASKHLNAVQFYVGVAGTYTLRIYTGADHSTLAATTVVSFSEEDVPAWHTINLPQPVAATQDIWIMVSNPDDTYWHSFTYCSGRPEALVIGTDEDNFYELGALDSWSWSAMIKGIFTDNSTPDLPLDTNTCVINTFPYFESFEENRLLCWYRYDVNQNNYSWSRTTGYGVNNSICWYISGQNECNDYLITPYINTPGEYTIEWKVRSWSEEYPEDYQVYLITESEESGEQLLLSDVVASSEYVTRTANFSITQDDGNSRIFFVYTSDGTKVYLFLDDFSIRNANAPQPTTYTIVAQPNDMQMGYVTGGGTFVAGATTTLTANALEGYHFVNWNDGSMQNPRTITVTGNATYTANFAEDETPQPTYYTITVNSNNDQWGMVTGSGTYQSGETVTLTATANSGYHFVSWQDGNQQNPRTITVTGNATYTATFAANATPGNCDVTTLPWNYSFITDSISDCWTNIDADGDGLDWTYYPNFGAVSFSYISDGQTYEYSLTPDNWLISPKVTLPAGGAEFHYTYINIAANYPDHIGVFVSTTNTDPSSFTLLEEYTAVAADTAWHTRTVSLAAYAGQQVYIAIRHYNSDDNYAFVVGSVSVTAGSTPVQNYTITANANNNSWGTVTGGGTYQSGATVTLTATANTGYHFVSWQDGNQQNPRTVTVTGNATYTATFAEDVVCLAVNSYPYNESFDESLGCWTAVDGNNDNNTWQLNTGMQNSDGSSVLPHSGNGMAASFSWNGDAFNVNEYLVSPQFVLPSGQTITLSWWYKVNGGYPEDKLAVRVSTTGNAVANFTATLVDITPTEANGTWTQYTLDLSSYAGQSIYLAFHHHDSYDMNYILLDDVQITAAAQQPPTQYTLTVVSANTNMGTATGSGTYDEGSQVEIRAISNPGYHFVSWSDNNTDSVRTVTVTANATYIATFAANPAPVQQYTLTVMSANTNMGTVTGGGTYDEGSQVEIRAISNPGYHFVSWSDNNTDSVRTVTVNSNATYIATFEQNNVGIDDRNLSDILLYPNPASSSVTLSGIDVEATVTLLDLNGREGASWRVTDGAITLDVSELVRGTYFLRIVTDSTTVVRKLIIK